MSALNQLMTITGTLTEYRHQGHVVAYRWDVPFTSWARLPVGSLSVLGPVTVCLYGLVNHLGI